MQNFQLYERQEQDDRGRFTPLASQATARPETATSSLAPDAVLTTDPPSSIAVTERKGTPTVDPNALTTVTTKASESEATPAADNSIISTPASSSTISDQSAATRLSDNAAAQPADGANSRAMSNGSIAAAVIVPCFLIGLLALILVLLRRRRQRKTDSSAARFVQNMQQREMPQQQYHIAPSGTHNTAYYTGLDTSSDRASDRELGQSFDGMPPPPYVKNATLPSQAPVHATPLPLVIAPDIDTRSSISWRTAPHEIHGMVSDDNYLSAAQQDGSRRSISSTTYSDSSSLHSARAARMSLGSAQMISTTTGDRLSPTTRGIDPFHDPDSPVSSVDGDETRALQGLDVSRAVSPISFASRRQDA